MKRLLKQLVQDSTGTSAVEYGMICAMIVLAMLTALRGVANENNGIWGNFSDKTKEAISNANGG